MRIALWTLLGLLVVAASTAVFLGLRYRKQILRRAVASVTRRVEARYPVRLLIGPARFTDLTTVMVDGIRLVPRVTGSSPLDTLLRVGRVTATVSLKSALKLRPVFSDIQLDDVQLTAVKRDSVTDNFRFLLKSPKRTAAQARAAAADSLAATRRARPWGRVLNGVVDAVFENIPPAVNFRHITVTYTSPRHFVRGLLPHLAVADGRFRGRAVLTVDSVRNDVRFNGTLNPSDYQFAVIAYPARRGARLTAPYIGRRYHAGLSLDTVSLLLDGKEYDAATEQCTVRGLARVKGLRVNHARLAAHDIIFPETAARFVATLGPDYASLNQPTAVQLGRLVVYPTASFRLRPSKQVELHVQTNELPANDVLASLPRGIFDEIDGMQAAGRLKYALDFKLDMAKLDELELKSNLQGTHFRVTRFGAADLSKLAREFPYTAYNDKGDSVKTFLVGPSNPEFVRYDEVSPYLPLAILTAEDPRFFIHQGFMESAFRKSMIQNLRERRFARGGSTLSMQLVKNVFLTRKKTIGRKVEEVLMTWIIEHNQPRFVSKERMFEVYLNVIEWGPKRYGVTEAARFFFGKRPADLTLNESLFLASIVPAPRRYRQSFDSYGNLRGKPRYFFKLISQLMHERGLISDIDYQKVWPGVTLAGAARDLIVTARDTTADTLDMAPLVPLDFIGPTVPPDLQPDRQLPMGAKKEDGSDVLE
ncbi:MAG: transglycosylase domain-containing protein [Hymenobacteraceae bacterium]|nr:transglycosylase domain-containing protein [Hymenobacteraceae bacterium]